MEGSHGGFQFESILADGELEAPHYDDCDGLWPHSPEAGGLDIRHRLPGLSVGLAASLRAMRTA
jgi:hypothetical protein